MIPNLSLLPSHADAPSELQVPRSTEELRRWLAIGDDEELQSHLRRLNDSLIAQQHHAPEPVTQLKLLRCYLSHIQKSAQAVRSRNFGLSLPLPAQAIDFTERLGNVHLHIANAYKAVVLDAAESDDTTSSLAANEIAQACYGSLFYLSQVLYCAYQGYRPYPNGIWYEIHQLYLYARSEEIAKHPVRSFSAIGKDTDTIEECYKRTVLLELADPYRMPYGMVDGVYKSLHDWTKLAKLVARPDKSHQRCLFQIDLEFDRPGIPLLPRATFKPSPQHLVLDSVELVADLHQQYEATAGMPDLEQRELLRSLIVQWGIQPLRSLNRETANEACEIIVGLNSINFMINLAANDITPVAKPKSNDDESEATTWQIIDTSPGGMQLVASGDSDTRISVGEMLGVRRSRQSEDWGVGIVRWVKHHDKARSNLGIHILGMSRIPVFIYTNPQTDDYDLGVIIETRGIHETRNFRLVAPNGVYEPKRRLRIVEQSDAADSYDAVVGELIAATRGSDCFDYSIVSTRPADDPA